MPHPAKLDVDALCFDLFDTLIDGRLENLPILEWRGRRRPTTAGVLHAHVVGSHEVELDRFLEVLREVDVELREEYFAHDRELPTLVRFRAVVERLGARSPSLAGELTELHMGMIREHSSVPGHHGALLERLRSRRPIALCSNFSHTATAVRLVEEFGLRPHLDLVVISEDVGIRKPRREIFDAVVEGLSVAPERILHIGDSLRADIGGAAALGMRTAWITRRVRDVEADLEAYDGPRPDLVVADLAEIEAALGD